ncbi:MAG: Hsp20/alpha crystallin family protein [Polyangiaceae bacterium]
MSDNRTEIQKSEGGKLPPLAEPTHSGPIFTPAVDIFETEQAITVLADMPGVTPETLNIDLRENVLTLAGRVADGQAQKEDVILREYQPGTFVRTFTLSEVVDQSKIDARLNDGVLRLELPKIEKAKPRQIAVRAG